MKNINEAMPCFCGHDCARCITYLATIRNDDDLRRQAQQFYKNMFHIDLPLSEIHCMGGRSDSLLKLCSACPWRKCCMEKKLHACAECAEYPCEPLAEYQKAYVNKCNQLEEEK